MVAMNRPVTLAVQAGWEQTLWQMSCRAVLRAIDWAAAACGVKDTANRIERAELLVNYGIPPELPHQTHGFGVDWARLDDFERGQLARELRRAGRPSPLPRTIQR